MKLHIEFTKAALLVALPIAVLVGCDNKQGATQDTTSVSSGTDKGIVDANNSGKNARDRDNANPTSGDQGGSTADLKTTQTIRQAIVSGTNDYSIAARNIKIITSNSKVILRGPVKTAEEKAGIETIAKNVAGEGNVQDQLEVEAKP